MKSESNKLVTVVIPGDLHLENRHTDNFRIGEWVVTQANEEIKPDFVQFIGDNAQHATQEQFHLFLEIADQLKCPWYALVGDHDVHNDPTASMFKDLIGETWGSVSIEGLRFIRLNTQEFKPVGMSVDQLIWFRSELKRAKLANERVVIFQHNYAYQIWESFEGTGMAEWRSLIQKNSIEALICGHTHYWQMANDGQNAHLAVRSIGDPEGGDAGYALACFDGANMGITYRTIADVGPAIVIMKPRRAILCLSSDHICSNSIEVSANVFSSDTITRVYAQIDDYPSFDLSLASNDLWIGQWNQIQLSKGLHRLYIKALDSSGVMGDADIDFYVDHTKRFTAIPSVDPVVESTNFC